MLLSCSFKTCGCVPHYLPHEADAPLCSFIQEECHDHVREDARQSSASPGKGIYEACNCIQVCERDKFLIKLFI